LKIYQGFIFSIRGESVGTGRRQKYFLIPMQETEAKTQNGGSVSVVLCFPGMWESTSPEV
jgi:hypothetical protein